MKDSNGEKLSPATLAQLIKDNPKYQPGMPVILNACRTGDTPKGGEAYAQKVANELGKGSDVRAPNGDVAFHSNGRETINHAEGTEYIHFKYTK